MSDPQAPTPEAPEPEVHPVHAVLDGMETDLEGHPSSFPTDVMAWIRHKIEVIRSML